MVAVYAFFVLPVCEGPVDFQGGGRDAMPISYNWMSRAGSPLPVREMISAERGLQRRPAGII